MPFRIPQIALDGSQRAGRVQAMSIGRSAAFQSAKRATCLLLAAQDVATGRRKRLRGLLAKDLGHIALVQSRPKKTPLCDNHHSENGTL